MCVSCTWWCSLQLTCKASDQSKSLLTILCVQEPKNGMFVCASTLGGPVSPQLRVPGAQPSHQIPKFSIGEASLQLCHYAAQVTHHLSMLDRLCMCVMQHLAYLVVTLYRIGKERQEEEEWGTSACQRCSCSHLILTSSACMAARGCDSSCAFMPHTTLRASSQNAAMHNSLSACCPQAEFIAATAFYFVAPWLQFLLPGCSAGRFPTSFGRKCDTDGLLPG